jgi:hypothetical protein
MKDRDEDILVEFMDFIISRRLIHQNPRMVAKAFINGGENKCLCNWPLIRTREEIRVQFFNETYWDNGQEEPDTDYVHWLEDKLIEKSNTPVIIEQNENRCLCSWPLMHTRENGVIYCGICQKDI